MKEGGIFVFVLIFDLNCKLVNIAWVFRFLIAFRWFCSWQVNSLWLPDAAFNFLFLQSRVREHSLQAKVVRSQISWRLVSQHFVKLRLSVYVSTHLILSSAQVLACRGSETTCQIDWRIRCTLTLPCPFSVQAGYLISHFRIWNRFICAFQRLVPIPKWCHRFLLSIFCDCEIRLLSWVNIRCFSHLFA